MKVITKETEFELVMLPTDSEHHVIIKKNSGKLLQQNKDKIFSGEKHHLHLITEGDVKKGEWCLHRVQHEYNLTKAWSDNPMECYSIIATTDKTLLKDNPNFPSGQRFIDRMKSKKMDESVYLRYPIIPPSVVKEFVESDGNIETLNIEMGYCGRVCNACGAPEDNHPYRHPFVGKFGPKLSANGSILIPIVEDTKQKIYHIMDIQSKEILISSTDEKKLEKIFVKMESTVDFIWSYDGEMIRNKVSK